MPEEMQVRIKRSKITRQWYWTVVAGNGKKVATSGESYRNRDDCWNMAATLFPSLPFVD